LDVQPWWKIDSELPVIMGISWDITNHPEGRTSTIHDKNSLKGFFTWPLYWVFGFTPSLHIPPPPLWDVPHPVLDKLGMVYYNYLINFITMPLS
jgi:hypothetical protein